MSDRKQKKHGYVECLKYMHMIKEGSTELMRIVFMYYGTSINYEVKLVC